MVMWWETRLVQQSSATGGSRACRLTWLLNSYLGRCSAGDSARPVGVGGAPGVGGAGGAVLACLEDRSGADSVGVLGAGGLLARGCGGFLGGAEVVLGFAAGFAELALGGGVDGGVGELGVVVGLVGGEGLAVAGGGVLSGAGRSARCRSGAGLDLGGVDGAGVGVEDADGFSSGCRQRGCWQRW